ncbi:Hap41 protein [Candida orthopsilosis Co 90-125]|uniref:Hap41 protein n=1 Tax=Candida orthopsilosis (strain 90-125) TaxID=1136231 RepID=H8WZF6_CANO9|nr:Hap41 protein [Candida orthopsilosis Co 90-125]CCG21824.1 Hap41 protein [Candida orthopsilosis Co 90-125]
MTTTMTASTAPILKQQPPTDEKPVQLKSGLETQSHTQHHSTEAISQTQEQPVTIKTSKEWVLPPRPKPGRKLKEIKAKKKCTKKSSSAPDTTATTTTTIKKAPTITNSTTRKVNKKHDCCTNDLNPDLSTVSSLLQNISIIDSENSCLKSNLLCLIHEYKHLKSLVLNSPPAPTEASEQSATNSSAATTTSELAESLPDDLAEMVDSITHEVRAVHKRSFVEVCDEEEDLLSEIEQITEDGEPLRRMSTPAPRGSIVSSASSASASSPIATVMGYNSSTVDTVASTPLPATLEFEEFINIEESDEKNIISNEAAATNPVPVGSLSTYRSKKFAHYKDFHKLDTEEDSDGDINFEDDDLINGGGDEEEEGFLGELCTPSSTSSHDLSRTTSPYSDYETNSLMSTLTRTTTGSSINTVIHEKPNFSSEKLHNNSGYTSIHPPPLTLKKMGNFFDLPKYQENDKLYSFKFDTAEYQAKRIDDEYNLVTDLLEEKLMSNEINYYSQQQQSGLGQVQGYRQRQHNHHQQQGLGHDDDDVNDRGSFMNFY